MASPNNYTQFKPWEYQWPLEIDPERVPGGRCVIGADFYSAFGQGNNVPNIPRPARKGTMNNMAGSDWVYDQTGRNLQVIGSTDFVSFPVAGFDEIIGNAWSLQCVYRRTVAESSNFLHFTRLEGTGATEWLTRATNDLRVLDWSNGFSWDFTNCWSSYLTDQ